MARIPEYTASVGADTLRNHLAESTPSDFGGSAGIVMGEAEQAVAKQAYDTAQAQEIGDGATKLAKLRSDWSQELERRINGPDGGKPDFAERFNEDLTNALSKAGDPYSTAGGIRHFQEGVAELTSALSERAGVYQAQQAGVTAKQNFMSFLQNNGTALYSDPTQFNSVMRDTLRTLNDPDGPYTNMPAPARGELQQYAQRSLAIAAAQGDIRVDPQKASDDLEAGKYSQYIKSEDLNSLLFQADRRIRAREVEDARIQAAQDKALKTAQEATMSQFLAQAIKDPTSLSTKTILDSNLTEPQKEHWLFNVMPTLLSPDKMAKADPAVVQSLWDRIHAPDGDPSKITDQDTLNSYFGHGLDLPWVQHLRDEIALKRTQEGSVESELKKGLLQTAKSTLTGTDPLLHLRDPKGDEDYLRFMNWFLPEYDKQRAAGKSAASLTNPDSPDYLGKTIAQYARTPAQKFRDLIINMNSPALGVPAGATATATAKDGTKIYQVNGKWVRGDGSEVK